MILSIESPLRRLRNLKSITVIVMPGAYYQRVTADSRHGRILANHSRLGNSADTDFATPLAMMHVDQAVQDQIRPTLPQDVFSV